MAGTAGEATRLGPRSAGAAGAGADGVAGAFGAWAGVEGALAGVETDEDAAEGVGFGCWC